MKILWLNGAFGAGKTTVSAELCRRLPGSFVFDAEEVGFFLCRNSPAELHTGDFQDMPQWRTVSGEMLRMLAASHSTALIVPMTVTNPEYYRQITAAAEAEGAEILHFVLYARRETVLARLRRRSLSLRRERFAVDALERCLTAFDGEMREVRIETDGRTPAQIAEEIARYVGLSLMPDRRGLLRRQWDRWILTLRHVR